MKKYKLIILFMLIVLTSVNAQSQETNPELDNLLDKGFQFLYTNSDSLEYYFEKGYKIAQKENDIKAKLTILSYLVFANDYHNNLNKVVYHIKRTDSLINSDSLYDTVDDKLAYKIRLVLDKANYYYKIRNDTKSLQTIEDLFEIVSKTPDSLLGLDRNDLEHTLNNYKGDIYYRQGKNELSKQYYNKNLKSSNKGFIASTNMLLSKVYLDEKNYQESNALILKTLTFYEKAYAENANQFRNNIIATYQKLADNYIQLKDAEAALQALKKSEKYYVDNDAFERIAELIYGDIYAANEQFDKAEAFYQSYLTKTTTYRENKKHQDIADAYSRLGRLYIEKKDPEQALKFYQKSLVQLTPNFDSENIEDNPDPKKVLSKLELVKVLKEKLKTLRLLYTKSNNVQDLKIAFNTSHDIIKTLDLLKPEFESKVDKQFLISEMYPAFHSMVEVAYKLYQTTKEPKYIDNSFYFMEKSKSVLLLEAARNSQANSYGGVPEKIIDKEQQFRANIIHLEKKFFDQKSNMVVFDSLFQLKNRYYNFISDIERDYPKYYDLKYNSEVTSLAETTSEIIKDKALLSYFSTNTNLFLITAENDKKNFYKIPLEKEDRERITNFYSLLSKVDHKDLPDIYKQGYLIYEKLLKEPLQEIQSNELIIIPDDILNYLPFDALLTSETSGKYLIEEYQISYANSATLLREQQLKPEAKKNLLLAYAPSFGSADEDSQKDRSDFGPLLHNTTEVNHIAKYFNGKAITGTEASLASFSENSQNYNILHFATHAATNDEHPDYSYLAFTPNKDGAANLLYVKDLYGFKINADLVALSACQTGLGKLQKGEGMLSLARGFSYAGAKSLVTTLWKINDQTTSELMQDFYKNLDASLPKDKALREAKLTYLNIAEDEFLTHPYYWSGFMISGDVTPLQTDTSYLWWLLLLGIPILFVGIRKVKSLL
ncbi:CHAT domain-containing protein [Aquimarina rubra]|uniref:CHAT domain-containing protein n=1 Tax=Aquimarina rubra TaxID=1920033 RepID=A0ABW5LID4_9FLAO